MRSAPDEPRGVTPPLGPVARASVSGAGVPPRQSPPSAIPVPPAALGRIAFPGAASEDGTTLAALPRPSRLSRGLPIIEFVMACAVVIALVFLGMREYRRAVLRARAATAAADLSVMRDGLLRYYSDCQDFPLWDGRPGDPGLLRRPADAAGMWGGPYLRRWPVSTPLGGRYSYHHEHGDAGYLAPVLEVEDVGRAEALELAHALGGGVLLELAPTGASTSAPERWTVRIELAHRLGAAQGARL